MSKNILLSTNEEQWMETQIFDKYKPGSLKYYLSTILFQNILRNIPTRVYITLYSVHMTQTVA